MVHFSGHSNCIYHVSFNEATRVILLFPATSSKGQVGHGPRVNGDRKILLYCSTTSVSHRIRKLNRTEQNKTKQKIVIPPVYCSLLTPRSSCVTLARRAIEVIICV